MKNKLNITWAILVLLFIMFKWSWLGLIGIFIGSWMIVKAKENQGVKSYKQIFWHEEEGVTALTVFVLSCWMFMPNPISTVLALIMVVRDFQFLFKRIGAK